MIMQARKGFKRVKGKWRVGKIVNFDDGVVNVVYEKKGHLNLTSTIIGGKASKGFFFVTEKFRISYSYRSRKSMKMTEIVLKVSFLQLSRLIEGLTKHQLNRQRDVYEK